MSFATDQLRRRRTLVCGGRGYSDESRLFAVLDDLCHAVVIHGQCETGADKLASRWARASGTPEISCPADWTRYRKAAGPIRNQQMLDEHTPGVVVAFPGGRGTADMIRRARKAGIPVLEIDGAPRRESASAQAEAPRVTDTMAQGLVRIRDRGPEAWCESMRGRPGGAVSHMFDRMVAMGLCTPPPHTITDLGRRAVQPYEQRMRARERRFLRAADGQ